ncbi:hypothetical protein BKA69DRAFT_536324 [Paraphysoderma sedebokerense]|nr:hypothetical protein BKA69DRAFT_536324 [Paraphysoderma sedebokerense]
MHTLFTLCSSDGRFLPYAAKGYWKVKDPRYLFLPCSPPAACPGSTSQICAEGYSGVRCGECQRGYYRQLTNCLSCQQSMQLAVVLIAAFLILRLICIYCLINHTRLGGPTFGIVSITLNFFQTIAIIREVNLKWPDEIRTVLDKFSLAMLNIEFLSPECFVADGTLNYSSRLKIILALPIAIS